MVLRGYGKFRIQYVLPFNFANSTKTFEGNLSDNEPSSTKPKSSQALVFVSHDTRDAEIAEAFSKLLGSVSAGVLKSFRSSDKKGNQGIEYGVDWYPEIMGRLKNACDVVCLLTPYSVNRPWILYEAGVAKGQLVTPVHGLALGIPLSAASTGPFAQFQNCDDSAESISSLVMQLVSRIPNAEPDRDVVVSQVETFQARVKEALAKQGHEETNPKNVDNSSVAKLFEEIKVMYQDLPGRIETRLDDPPRSRRKHRRFHPEMIFESIHSGRPGENPFLGLLIVLSQFRDDFSWMYDIAYDIYVAEELGDGRKVHQLTRSLLAASHSLRRNPMLEEMMMHSKDHHILVRELPMMLDSLLSMANDRSESLGRLKAEPSDAPKSPVDRELNS